MKARREQFAPPRPGKFCRRGSRRCRAGALLRPGIFGQSIDYADNFVKSGTGLTIADQSADIRRSASAISCVRNEPARPQARGAAARGHPRPTARQPRHSRACSTTAHRRSRRLRRQTTRRHVRRRRTNPGRLPKPAIANRPIATPAPRPPMPLKRQSPTPKATAKPSTAKSAPRLTKRTPMPSSQAMQSPRTTANRQAMARPKPKRPSRRLQPPATSRPMAPRPIRRPRSHPVSFPPRRRFK